MKNLKNMIGSIKKINNITKSSEKTIDAMIVDYTYNPNTSIHRQHKIYYVTTSGVVGSIYVNDKTSYTDITTTEHVKKHLSLIKDAIIRRKKAHEAYLNEGKNIENLTLELLKEEDGLSKESFIEDLNSKLSDKSITLYREDIRGQSTNLIYDINESVYLEITLKKHYLKSLRLSTYKNTYKEVGDINFAHKKIGRFLDILNEDKYNDFIKNYMALDSSNTDFIKFLEINNLSINHNSNDLIQNKDDSYIYFKSLDILESRSKDDVILLNNDTINMILNFIDFIK